MKKKILVVLLIVLALTSVVQLAMISHPKTVEATTNKGEYHCCKECYYAFGHLWCFTYCGYGIPPCGDAAF